MASAPSYAATPKIGAALLGSAESSLTSPVNSSTIITAGASGTKIEEIRFQSTATTVNGLLYMFLHDGSAYRIFDMVVVPVVTLSNTVAAFQNVEVYDNLVLPSGWSLRVSQSAAANANLIICSAFGADL